MPTNDNDAQLHRLAEHKWKSEYIYFLAFFRKHNFALEAFMDTIESADYRYFQGYLTEIKGYDVEAAENYYLEAFELYNTMVAVDENTYHYVMRTHSHTDKQCLWKVMSRRIHTKLDAESWLTHMEQEELRKHPKSKHEFFIITKQED